MHDRVNGNRDHRIGGFLHRECRESIAAVTYSRKMGAREYD